MAEPPYFAQNRYVFFIRTIRFRPVVIGFFARRAFQLHTVAKRHKFTKFSMVLPSVPSSNLFSRTILILRVSPHPSPQWEWLLDAIHSCLQGVHRRFVACLHPRHRSVLSSTAGSSREGAVLSKTSLTAHAEHGFTHGKRVHDNGHHVL